MRLNSDILEINNFTLTSSTAISTVLDDLEKLEDANVLVHIVSVIHNTVLVQSLKNEIGKIPPLNSGIPGMMIFSMILRPFSRRGC